MIAFYGYDGFLYSIGFFAAGSWRCSVIADRVKRLGRFTFCRTRSIVNSIAGITGGGISTLVVSVFYLIRRWCGAGSLVKPLLGLSHEVGVVTVGVVVILITVTAGDGFDDMVQFIKGGMLVIFCAILTVMILNRG